MHDEEEYHVSISGASDDLIHVSGTHPSFGPHNGFEFNTYLDADTHFAEFIFNEGTVIRVHYIDGFWRVTRAKEGHANFMLEVGDNSEYDYSDGGYLWSNLPITLMTAFAYTPKETELTESYFIPTHASTWVD